MTSELTCALEPFQLCCGGTNCGPAVVAVPACGAASPELFKNSSM